MTVQSNENRKLSNAIKLTLVLSTDYQRQTKRGFVALSDGKGGVIVSDTECANLLNPHILKVILMTFVSKRGGKTTPQVYLSF